MVYVLQNRFPKMHYASSKTQLDWKGIELTSEYLKSFFYIIITLKPSGSESHFCERSNSFNLLLHIESSSLIQIQVNFLLGCYFIF